MTGIENLTATALCLNTWRSSDHISDLISIPNTNRLGTNPCTTTFFHCHQEPRRSHFLNCEATSLYESRECLEESGWKTCFNDFTDLMCAARLGKDRYITHIACYSSDDDDTNPRFVSWAIFEIVWGKTLNRSTGEEEDLTRSRMSMNRVAFIMLIKATLAVQLQCMER